MVCGEGGRQMAVVVPSARSAKIPVGPHWMQTFTVASTGDDKADEWFVSGFGNIVAIIGDAVIGTAGSAVTNNYMKNLAGTGGAATPGAVAFQTKSGAALTMEVTVLGD